jgi:hypothetical protein
MEFNGNEIYFSQAARKKSLNDLSNPLKFELISGLIDKSNIVKYMRADLFKFTQPTDESQSEEEVVIKNYE